MQDLLFKNAKIVTSTNCLTGDLLVKNGKIADFGHKINNGNAKIIDATNKYLMPGGIDVHTHFDLDVGFDRASDNFYTGSVAAACGGTTTIVDHMAFGPKDCRLSHQLNVYKGLAKDCVIDFGLHGTIQHLNNDVIVDMETLYKEEGLSSFKIYLTYDYMLNDTNAFKILQRAGELGLVICVHCENDGAINTLRSDFVAQGKTEAKYHPLSRPAEAEAEAIYRILMLASMAGDAKIYIVHISTGLGAEIIQFARKNGQKNIYAETCPQYLFLDDHKYNDPKEGLKYIMSPPLRKKHDIDTLWQAVADGTVDTIATDHCPFYFATQRQRGKDNFTMCPNGAPGVELRMSLIFSHGLMQHKITPQQMVRLCTTRPAEIFGLAEHKGDIAIGKDADLVLFDPDIKWTITKSLLHENVDYTPYEGIELQGKPILTTLRGNIISENGQFKGAKGFGNYIKRTIGK